MGEYFNELMRDGVPKELPSDMFAFEDCFDEYVADTQKTWSHDRKTTVGASEAFGCIRKSWFGKVGHDHGFERDEDYEESWGAVRRGDLIENHHVVPAIETGLQRRGMELIMCGDGQDTIIKGPYSATLDGLVIHAPLDLLAAYGVENMGVDNCVLEMKSFDPRINITEAKGIHIGQTQMQMGLIRETTEYKPQYAVVMYVNASWIDDIRIFIVEFDQAVYDEGKRRAEKLYATTDPASLPAEGKLDGMCEYCPFKKSCQEVQTSRIPEQMRTLTAKQVNEQDPQLLEDLEDYVSRCKSHHNCYWIR